MKEIVKLIINETSQQQSVIKSGQQMSDGIIQSMSRKGKYMDHVPMEIFFGIMKNEMFYGHGREQWMNTSTITT